MKKETSTLLLLGALGIGAYYLLTQKQDTRTEQEKFIDENVQVSPEEVKNFQTVIKGTAKTMLSPAAQAQVDNYTEEQWTSAAKTEKYITGQVPQGDIALSKIQQNWGEGYVTVRNDTTGLVTVQPVNQINRNVQLPTGNVVRVQSAREIKASRETYTDSKGVTKIKNPAGSTTSARVADAKKRGVNTLAGHRAGQ